MNKSKNEIKEIFGQYLDKMGRGESAENIITEFLSTLDHKYPVATDFENVYKYLMDRLLEANLKKDKEILEEVLMHLRTMRDTWKEVMEQNKATKAN